MAALARTSPAAATDDAQGVALEDIPGRAAGRVLDLDAQREAKLQSRRKREVASLRADRNRWCLACFCVLGGLLFCANGWRIANDRFANNTHVEWVKLSPDGGISVEHHDPDSETVLFEQTVTSELYEFVESRFNKHRSTIKRDYGVALLFMSDELARSFRRDYNAADVAAAFVDCVACEEVTYETRNLEHLEAINYHLTSEPDDKVYRTLVYATVVTTNSTGIEVDRSTARVRLEWIFTGKRAVRGNKKAVRYNPLGIKILRTALTEDALTSPPTQ